jgi:DNA repair photolyase
MDNQLTENKDYPGHIIDIINQVSEIPEAMISFATKSASFDSFIKHVKKPEMTRIRLSLMPEHHRVKLEMNTAKIIDRLNAINKLVDAGFEVHINLSPIVVTENFAAEYADLLKLVNETLSKKAKDQLAYEIIFLTHSASLFYKTPMYAPEAHNMMVNGPLKLEPKWNKPTVLSYSRKDKDQLKTIMHGLIDEFTPYARIRYMF